jgi:hypothetical protein
VNQATPELVRLLDGYFAAKTQARVDSDPYMDYFSRTNTHYLDAVMGWRFDGWEASRDVAREMFKNWGPGARSYATRIVGDTDSAAVFRVDSTEMFGAEIRAIAAVDFEDEKIVRWVDYWNGLTWPADHLEQLSAPMPDDLAEGLVDQRRNPAVRDAADRFIGGDVSVLAPDVEFSDHTLERYLAGATQVAAYLERALPQLPYGEGVVVRRVLGGGFEWTSRDGLRGFTALELDREGRITRADSIWDGRKGPGFLSELK